MKISDFLKIDSTTTSLLALTYLLNKPKSYILTNQDTELSSEIVDKLSDIIDKRKKHYPLQYAIGYWQFYNLLLKVDERALIPRFETEIIVDYLVKASFKKDRILDIGTGSGAIALSLADKLKESLVLGTDIEEKALSLARENKARLNILNAHFAKSDLFESVEGKFDLIISNPPYISKKDYENLEQELYYEPKSALYGGEDGLIFYRRIIEESPNYINDGGHLVFEIGYDQKDIINKIMKEYGFINIINIKDFNDFDRFIIAQKG